MVYRPLFGSISLLIGNQFCCDLPIIILRYYAEPFSETIFRNSLRIPTNQNIFEKWKKTGSLNSGWTLPAALSLKLRFLLLGASCESLSVIVCNWPSSPLRWAPVSEPGFLHFPKNISKFGIGGEFLKMVSKNGSAQYRRINIRRLLQNWFPMRRLMVPQNMP